MNIKIDAYIQQQQLILQKLAKTNPDVEKISWLEDLLFRFASQGLSVPLNINLVSFFDPASMLAPDDDYYLRLADNPAVLNISKIYFTNDMPDYQLVNIGLANLDATLAVADLKNYLNKQLVNDRFSFVFQENILEPEVEMSLAAIIADFIKYVSVRALVLCMAVFVLWLIKRSCTRFQEQQKQIADLKLHVQELIVQTKYLRIDNQQAWQSIDVQTLTEDMLRLNANLAQAKKLSLHIGRENLNLIRLKLPLKSVMQILSGILYLQIQQNIAGSKIEVKIKLIDSNVSQRRIVFIFNDNGFYDSLTDCQDTVDTADIRCKNWENIYALAQAIDANIEYIHKVYEGNQIIVDLNTQPLNNIVSLESYCFAE